jgi:hypothetical protein
MKQTCGFPHGCRLGRECHLGAEDGSCLKQGAGNSAVAMWTRGFPLEELQKVFRR